MGLRETLEAATPGKWMVFQFQRGKGKTLWHAIDSVHGGRRVAELCSYYTCDRQAENDATLIALAPELAAEVLELRERHREAMALVLDMGEELRAWLEMSRHAGNAESPTTESLLARLDQIGVADETRLGKEQT